MLEDRDYMRQPAYHQPRVSFTVALLIVNAIVFVVQLAASHSFNNVAFEGTFQGKYFALSLDGLKHGYVWQLITFQLMHAGWLHIIFNSIVIYFFGRAVETVLGRSQFLILYFASGIIGGLVQMLFASLLPQYFDAPVVGASAGASGLIAAFAVLYWEQQFTVLIYFILPVTLRGKTLFWGSIAFTVICGLIPNTGIANAAHLGGMLTGIIFIRQFIQGRWHWPQWKFSGRRREPPEFISKGAGKKSFWRSANKPDEDFSTDEFLQNEVDPILEKISQRGIQSLTAREHEILEKARTKMKQR
jgi:membrane associated rhomboid family serine protease